MTHPPTDRRALAWMLAGAALIVAAGLALLLMERRSARIVARSLRQAPPHG